MSPEPSRLDEATNAVLARVLLDFCRRERVTILPPDVVAFLEEKAAIIGEDSPLPLERKNPGSNGATGASKS